MSITARRRSARAAWETEAWDRFCSAVEEGRSDNIVEVRQEIPDEEFEPLSLDDILELTEFHAEWEGGAS